MSTQTLDKVDYVMMDALSRAERLAFDNPESHACVYRDLSTPEAYGKRVHVRIAGEPAPENTELVTTVTRRTPKRTGSSMYMSDAVAQVLANLPADVKLHDRVVVEHYPANHMDRWYPHLKVRRVFAYEFLSTEMRNVATWIPDTAINGVMMQTGFDGRGRQWKNGDIADEVKEDIGWMIRAALVKALDPGNDSTELFIKGWRMAENFLRSGTSPDDDLPKIEPEETYNGYIGRMARQRELTQTPAVSAPAPRRLRR